ncbi:MAG: hypothetical protein OJF49_001463 [Ktedonobacterales bacterium]|jgi:formylglycine-generating enzyme required for sulfatase activity|nr:MAG: hypothetical protein OJF49_001463 [Ktedonobacterales bacterium]
MTSPAASDTPRIFVSHSHEDDDFCRTYVTELRRLLSFHDAVWYDEHNMGSGELLREIQRQLHQRPIFIVILSPAALHRSRWVPDECAWAYDLYQQETGRTILPVTGAPITAKDFVPDWIYLRGFRRIEAPNLQPYPPQEAARRTVAALPSTVQATPTATLTSNSTLSAPAPASPPKRPRAREGGQGGPILVKPVLSASTPTPKPSAPALPPDQFPPRLASLGFTVQAATDTTGKRIPYILPPLCSVPAGLFRMGSDPRQGRAMPDEEPQHDVTLPSYQIARYPITVAEYACFVHSGHNAPTDWATQQGKLDHPVIWVSWHDAVAYAKWLAKLTGQPWRLPTEAEWEKAARWDPPRRVSRLYPWGDTFDKVSANTSESGNHGTTPVGTYPHGASPCGAQDMVGNVLEWCSSLYRPYSYNSSLGREEMDDSTDRRVLRGGSWYAGTMEARAAFRGNLWPGVTDYFIGFRLALAIPIS